MMLRKMTCRALIVSMFALSVQTAGAGMIGAERADPVQADRALVMGVLDRTDAASQLLAQGIDPAQARERIAAMNDQEVQQLAQDIRTAPAGANAGVIAAVVIIAAAVWYFVFRN